MKRTNSDIHGERILTLLSRQKSGELSTEQLFLQLEAGYGFLLNSVDHEVPSSEQVNRRPRENWKIRVGATKKYLRSRGWISDSPNSLWRISEAGRRRAKELAEVAVMSTSTRDRIIYGDIVGYEAPQEFENRRAAFLAGVHRQTQAGISGGAEGVDAICLSDGYSDDAFDGDLITYTGFGGQDPTTRLHIADQQLIRGNLGLVRNYELERPVRVLVKKSVLTKNRRDSSYLYVGLYVVVHWDWALRDGFKILVYQLKSLTGQTEAGLVSSIAVLTGGAEEPERRDSLSSRIVRDYSVAEAVKRLYADTCQVCRTQLRTAAGTYSEAAHIRPLGAPHRGPDVPSNLLCLCPNCHKQFDGHALTIDDDGSVFAFQTRIGALHVHPRHPIDKEHLAYHRASSVPQS
ncbi:putative restriction endonuclease [Pseudarthrobacter defluvii]|uniref:YDG/SRA domain-containing protein n=1 Tax=Pseudarthrobacter defluvii TaxID=410837 RepID=UPI00278A44E3|nr:YDG/SRA domain-containing protein [Pseudarthrobacter defluvii]MDQ0768192.1 putative restriction endonuclease [Pseudarthrobacter defluvii]